MVWVVRLGDTLYATRQGGSTDKREDAARFETRTGAMAHAGGYFDTSFPRIVRLVKKPRAAKPCHDCAWSHWKEIEVRKAERERIAAALAHGNAMQWLLLGDRVLMSREGRANPVPQARDIILEFDWKPEQK